VLVVPVPCNVCSKTCFKQLALQQQKMLEPTGQTVASLLHTRSSDVESARGLFWGSLTPLQYQSHRQYQSQILECTWGCGISNRCR